MHIVSCPLKWEEAGRPGKAVVSADLRPNPHCTALSLFPHP